MPHLILENKNLILFLNLKFNFMNDILKCSPKRFLFSMVVAFKDFDYSKGIYGSDWAGFRNFLFLFNFLE